MIRAADLLPEMDIDREMELGDFVQEFDRDALIDVLRSMLGARACLRDAAGRTALGDDAGADAVCWPVRGELEPIGYVCAETVQGHVQGAARLVEMLIHAIMRYRQAAALHLHTVRDDYLELKRRHDALEESEARYRQLSQVLEQRVQEQVRALETAHRQLYQAEKLRAVGQLAAGVAHEINNPIGFMKSNLTTAQSYVQRLMEFGRIMRQATDGESLHRAWSQDDMDGLLRDFAELLGESLDGAGRVARIVADLKGFSRVDSQGKEQADVNEIIRGVCNVTAPQLGGQVKVMLDLTPVPSIHSDAAALGQVFYNLLTNAAEAMHGVGKVYIATRHERGEIQIQFEDEGPGMAPGVLPRIFEPFYTTKPVGEGTGLGLTLCVDVVRAHGGRMEADNRAGTGAVFRVFLPIIQQRA